MENHDCLKDIAGKDMTHFLHQETDRLLVQAFK